MSQDDKQASCPICNHSNVKNIDLLQDSPYIKSYECERCGRFEINRSTESYFRRGEWAEKSYLISAWIRRENNSGNIPVVGEGVVMKDWIESLKHAGFPETTSEKLDALLFTLANIKGNDYDAAIRTNQPWLIAEIALNDHKQLTGLLHILEEMGYIESIASHTRKITGKGWLRVDELQEIKIASDSAFIAMWFNETTKEYRKAVVASVEYCGFKPVILDQEEYSGFIMEQAILQIKQARFVVADFTCEPESIDENGKVRAGVRGGVYWEAGMAYGLNRPVIHTCKDSDASKIRRHFDVNQYNTIFWKPEDLSTSIRNLTEKIDAPTFAERLANRILWVVGKGGYTPQ